MSLLSASVGDQLVYTINKLVSQAKKVYFYIKQGLFSMYLLNPSTMSKFSRKVNILKSGIQQVWIQNFSWSLTVARLKSQI